ncbi:phosphate ABC transporter substrate-binding protein [Oribacterium sp. C9]|uniref:phosphate ABC transporter substrate-binding protein n=1 Tax=Oribacterium sp. C9 TaxID=1943579 RepID=UPI00098ED0C2|nr:phosphate ABC transporter substrate-binding protein [Oribacterium sp. C9]OON87196.1 phosphate ABC transporter substrate-binding protein [Oribacterium sp. C9]
MTLKRILAIIALIVIAILLVLLLFFAFTGAKKEYILAVMFCLIVVPSVIYVFIWFTNLTKK